MNIKLLNQLKCHWSLRFRCFPEKNQDIKATKYSNKQTDHICKIPTKNKITTLSLAVYLSF